MLFEVTSRGSTRLFSRRFQLSWNQRLTKGVALWEKRRLNNIYSVLVAGRCLQISGVQAPLSAKRSILHGRGVVPDFPGLLFDLVRGVTKPGCFSGSRSWSRLDLHWRVQGSGGSALVPVQTYSAHDKHSAFLTQLMFSATLLPPYK